MGRSLHFPFWFSNIAPAVSDENAIAINDFLGIEEVCGTADAGSELCFLVDVFTERRDHWSTSCWLDVLA